ncbi:MAG: hypothetical protein R3E95_20000 [Thiolinea sp.]
MLIDSRTCDGCRALVSAVLDTIGIIVRLATLFVDSRTCDGCRALVSAVLDTIGIIVQLATLFVDSAPATVAGHCQRCS